MARPRKAVVDYFPHDCHHGKTIPILEKKFGLIGYAVWFKLLEQLGKTNGHAIDCKDEIVWMHLSTEIGVEEEELDGILNLLSRLGAIDSVLWGVRVIASENFLAGVEDAYRKRKVEIPSIDGLRRINGVYGAETPSNGSLGGINPQSKVKETKPEETKPEIPFEKLLTDNMTNPNVKEAWARWCAYRKEVRKKLTKSTAEGQIKLLGKLEPQVIIATIENSITNGWQGLFPDKVSVSPAHTLTVVNDDISALL